MTIRSRPTLAPWMAIIFSLLVCDGAHSLRAQTSAPPRRDAATLRLLTGLVTAEDRRGHAAGDSATLERGLRSTDPWLRRYAVRALGRFERPSSVARLVPILDDSDPTVRAAAALAIGQSVAGATADTAPARAAERALSARAAQEASPVVLGAIAEAQGRVPLAGRRPAAALATIVGGWQAGRVSSPEWARGVARGLFFFSRMPARRAGLTATDLAPVAALAAIGRGRDASDSLHAAGILAEVRREGTAALFALDGATTSAIAVALSDPDPWVRREGVGALLAAPDSAFVRAVLPSLLADAHPAVRHRAQQAAARRLPLADRCERLRGMTDDAHPSVSLAALDALGGCADGATTALLRDVAARPRGPGWHAPAHALVALARVAPDAARDILPSFATDASVFVRSYAAQAARVVADTITLRTLARDRHPVVASAALSGLAAVAGRGADNVAIRALASNDSELLMAASSALHGTPRGDAVPTLIRALARVSALRRETSRDGRVALLTRIGALGDASRAASLRPYLTDFDPVVADSAARILTRWTGRPVAAASRALRPGASPTAAELLRWDGRTVRITMDDGRAIDLRLFPFDAPTNVGRFVRLVNAGWFDGLTFHRVAPFFVVQGGSPSANEYAGDGPFTRDEIGVSNRRGTVGLSTRGRDTGDGQIYINLVPNVRLDTDYTILAEVTSGMDVVDQLQEGARIRRVRMVTP